MKYLFLTQVFYPDTASIGQHLQDLAEKLVSRGDTVEIITSINHSNKLKKKFKKVEYFKGIKITRIRHFHSSKSNLILRGLTQISFSFYATIYCFFKKFDMLILTTTPIFSPIIGSIIYFFNRKKIFFWCMDINPDQLVKSGLLKNKIIIKFLDLFNKYILKKANIVVTLDNYMKTTLEKKYNKRKINVIPPWSHDENLKIKFKKENFHRKYNCENKIIVMYSGNHTYINPLNTLIETAKILKNNKKIIFFFIGDGNSKKELQDYSFKNKLKNIRFLDYLPLNKLKFSLSAADIQVITLGKNMTGVIHPCKIYNILKVKKKILFIGPEKSHIGDILRKYKCGAIFKHGENKKISKYLLKFKKNKINNLNINEFSQENLMGKILNLI